MLSKAFISLTVGITFMYGQTVLNEGHISVNNGLWHLHEISTDQNRNRKWDSDREFIMCVGDGGNYVPLLIGRVATYNDENTHVAFSVRNNNTEDVSVEEKSDLLIMRLTFKSSINASAEGTNTSSEGKFNVQMDLDYWGPDCQGIGPGHRRIKNLGEWQ
jgi:hypothetical protein